MPTQWTVQEVAAWARAAARPGAARAEPPPATTSVAAAARTIAIRRFRHAAALFIAGSQRLLGRPTEDTAWDKNRFRVKADGAQDGGAPIRPVWYHGAWASNGSTPAS